MRAPEALPRILHVTTVDMSLELLLGPQLRAFADAGYEVHTASAPGPWTDALEADGIVHHPLTHSTRAPAPHRDLLALGELHRLFRRLRPAIVHTHNPKPGLLGRIAGATARVPVVVNTVHGLYATPDDPLPRRLFVYALERFAATFSDAELVQNPEDVAVLRRLRIPESKLTLLGNGVDLARFGASEDFPRWRLDVRASLGLHEEAVVVGAVGRLVAEKGYPELFTAMRTVRADHPEAVLVVIGPDDPDKPDALDDATRSEAAEAGVRFAGERSDVQRWYAAMDLYVLASHREGWPRSAMEAAAAGLPIVATDIRGCRQVVDNGLTGVLVPVRDPASLADAIGRLVADSHLRTGMGEAAARKARRDFDQSTVIDITLATYERLLADA